MAIKDLVDQVRSQISSEDSEKVSVLLEQIKNEATNLIASKAAVDTEAKDRRIKNREHESTIQGLEIERDDWKTKFEAFDDTPLKTELTTLKEKYSNVIVNQAKSFATFHNTIKDHPNYEKAKPRFKFPEGDNGELDFSKLPPEDIEHNINAQSDLQQLEYFGDVKPSSPATGKTIIDGKTVPTAAEYQDIRTQHGIDSPQAREALQLRRQSQRGVPSSGFAEKQEIE